MDVRLRSGDVVVLYADAIAQAEDINGVRCGLNRLCEVTFPRRKRRAAEIEKAAIASLREHIGDRTVYDDIALLAFKQK